jgi:hypothetical protein
VKEKTLTLYLCGDWNAGSGRDTLDPTPRFHVKGVEVEKGAPGVIVRLRYVNLESKNICMYLRAILCTFQISVDYLSINV